MEIQVALDEPDLPRSLTLAGALVGEVERFEVGTPLILRHGMAAIEQVRAVVGTATVVADCKVMDYGGLVAAMAIHHGADSVIVQAAAPLSTIAAVCAIADQRRKAVMLDDLGIDCGATLLSRIASVASRCISHVVVHTGKDDQRRGATPGERVAELSALAPSTPIAVAGGLAVENVVDFLGGVLPDVLIVGEALCGADDPVLTARALRVSAAQLDERGIQ